MTPFLMSVRITSVTGKFKICANSLTFTKEGRVTFVGVLGFWSAAFSFGATDKASKICFAK